jgi:hypothetical protein
MTGRANGAVHQQRAGFAVGCCRPITAAANAGPRGNRSPREDPGFVNGDSRSASSGGRVPQPAALWLRSCSPQRAGRRGLARGASLPCKRCMPRGGMARPLQELRFGPLPLPASAISRRGAGEPRRQPAPGFRPATVPARERFPPGASWGQPVQRTDDRHRDRHRSCASPRRKATGGAQKPVRQDPPARAESGEETIHNRNSNPIGLARFCLRWRGAPPALGWALAPA